MIPAAVLAMWRNAFELTAASEMSSVLDVGAMRRVLVIESNFRLALLYPVDFRISEVLMARYEYPPRSRIGRGFR